MGSGSRRSRSIICSAVSAIAPPGRLGRETTLATFSSVVERDGDAQGLLPTGRIAAMKSGVRRIRYNHGTGPCAVILDSSGVARPHRGFTNVSQDDDAPRHRRGRANLHLWPAAGAATT